MPPKLLVFLFLPKKISKKWNFLQFYGVLVSILVFFTACSSHLSHFPTTRSRVDPKKSKETTQVATTTPLSEGKSLQHLSKQEQSKGLSKNGEIKMAKEDKDKDKKTKADRYPGNNQFFNQKAAQKPQEFQLVEGAVLLNFENTSIQEVVKTLLGDILEENYVIDPAIQGVVTVQTGRPLGKNMLIPTLESLLGMNGAALVRVQGMYKVIPANQAIPGNLTPHLKMTSGQGGIGYQVRIVPLKYIGAGEMEKILTPFVPEGSIIRVDPVRSLIILAGSHQELDQWQETVDIFDVNWLKGMSVGLYRLKQSDATAISQALETLFGPEANTPLAGMFRMVPLEQLNGILVITSQSEYLKEAETWIKRLDLGEQEEDQEHFYFYQVQNGVAEDLAMLLQETFGIEGSGSAGGGGRVAPGQQRSSLSSGGMGRSGGMGGGMSGGMGSSGGMGMSGGGFGSSGGMSGGGTRASFKATKKTTHLESNTQINSLENPEVIAYPAGADEGGSKTKLKALGAALKGKNKKEQEEPEVRIVPDITNNALLIAAKPPMYEKIKAVLRQVDIPPRQVLVEASIAEVQLSGNLSLGIEWFFKNAIGKGNGNDNFGGTGVSNSGFPLSPMTSAAVPGGFTYAVTSGASVNALLNMAAQESKLNVLSSPQLLVLDNQTAQIMVGSQVPILSSQAALGGIAGGGALTSQVQYKNTGVMLAVTPRVNAGGRVTLEIDQQVTDVGASLKSGGIDNPTFLQRAFQSVVTVQDGQTIVLGGLIQTNDTFNKSGIPALYKIPIIGNLFGSTTNGKKRTELVVLMTPRVVENQTDATLVTNEMRKKMKYAEDVISNERIVEQTNVRTHMGDVDVIGNQEPIGYGPVPYEDPTRLNDQEDLDQNTTYH
ncbi:type II secretion system secretin GspD [Candidatus Nitrosacidococcus sp. I8]|uniref:type II secretion system secretin GspD n=1 Tax=Candidatus Nitrosacidococcus sp. I8 TaxID=2942908 RepID=UPI0022263138|nr:type II secretion system secretin GspD [Candidatus Nitrosacidococcus sp. I8]CAH9014805.1 Secretin XpsD [Candidatus Nitrosacidococcus sp. I8]